MMIFGYLLLGLVAGVASGILGIGGAIIIIPCLIYIFGFSQLLAQGTTLALMVPPIGLGAALMYYNRGQVDIRAAIFICLAFFIGGLLGAKYSISIPVSVLRKIFAALLFAVAIRMFFQK